MSSLTGLGCRLRPTASILLAALAVAAPCVAALDAAPAMAAGPAWGTPQVVSTETLLGTPVGLTAVSCASATFCAAIDALGNAFTYNGSSWSGAQPIAPDHGFEFPLAISCSSGTFCVVGNLEGLASTYNGSSWSTPVRIDDNPFGAISSLSCPSASFCAAGDNDGYVLTYDGGSWSSPQRVDLQGNKIGSMSCPSASFCMAVDGGVGPSVGYALAYDGSTWTESINAVDDATGGLQSVSCPSASFCAAVDQGGNAVIYSGESWGAPQSIDFAQLKSVSCPSASFCVTVDGSGLATPYNGTSWGQPQLIDALQGVNSVSCPSATFCAAVDSHGNAAFYEPPPADSAAPVVSGAEDQGDTLSASTGSWSYGPTSYAYQWEDCSASGSGCAPISGATSSSYTLTTSDVGDTIVVLVTAANSSGIGSPASSSPTAVVTQIAPASTSPPTISGSAAVGSTLSATPGGFSGSVPLAYAYQWERCAAAGPTTCTSAIPGATGSTYRLTSADQGAFIRVVVAAHNSAGTSSGASSPTGPVAIPSVLVTSALAKIAPPSGQSATIARILGLDGYTASFTSPSGGTLTIDWYTDIKAGHPHRKILVADTRIAIRKPGRAIVKVKLTKAGTKLLRHSKTLRVIDKTTFRPIRGKAVTRTSTFRIGHA